MKNAENFRVPIHDADLNGIATASSVLRYMQEAAHMQFVKNPPTLEELRNGGKVFLLSKLNMSIYSPITAYDQIVAESWPCESKGVSFNRCGRILRGGVIVAELVSVWAFMDLSERRLLKTSDFSWNVTNEEPLELDFPTRIKIPKDIQLILVGERQIVYSDLDGNGHMNNTKYPDMLCDFLPSMKNKRVAVISLNYTSELPLGENIKIYLGENDGTYYFRTVKEDGMTGAEAEMILEDIDI